MAPYIGEIRLFAGNFPINGWAWCDGQLMSIAENDALFTLIGTTYGGDGQETFGIPDLRGRAPVHMGQGPGISQVYQIGEQFGVEDVTLTVQQIPSHRHTPLGTAASGTQSSPSGGVWATSAAVRQFVPGVPDQPMAAGTLASTGGSQPHENMPPFLVLSYIISLFGVFPSQT